MTLVLTVTQVYVFVNLRQVDCRATLTSLNLLQVVSPVGNVGTVYFSIQAIQVLVNVQTSDSEYWGSYKEAGQNSFIHETCLNQYI